MGLLEWFGRSGAPREDARLRDWKRAWRTAVLAREWGSAGELRSRLDAFGLSDEDVEIEREMLHALEAGGHLCDAINASGLPVVETGHRVVGREICHFAASAAMPDEPGQPTGRLLLTSGRAIFVGGPNGVATAWHTIGEAQHTDRDVVLVRTSRDRLYRFQCNSFEDAVRAMLISRELIARRRT